MLYIYYWLNSHKNINPFFLNGKAGLALGFLRNWTLLVLKVADSWSRCYLSLATPLSQIWEGLQGWSSSSDWLKVLSAEVEPLPSSAAEQDSVWNTRRFWTELKRALLSLTAWMWHSPTQNWIQTMWEQELNALWLCSALLSIIVLLHYGIVSGAGWPQSRHQSQVCRGRLTRQINYHLPRWMGLDREQWPDTTFDRISQVIFPPSIHLSRCQLLPLMSFSRCQRARVHADHNRSACSLLQHPHSSLLRQKLHPTSALWKILAAQIDYID